MPEKKDRLDLPVGYDPEADPLDFTERAKRGAGTLASKLRRLAKLKEKAASTKNELDALTREIVPEMRRPVMLVIGGKRVMAQAGQAKPIVVDARELRQALLDYGYDEDDVEVKMRDVLKPEEVDVKENGLLEQAVKDGRIPLEVFGKVAREKPSSAYVKFS